MSFELEEEEEDAFEHTLVVVREASVLKILSRSTSSGYKCSDWLQTDKIWENAVESVLDSLRYFVLKIEDGTGKHAFIGLWFTERNEAFDFNVALSDHEKYVKRESEKEDVEIFCVENSPSIKVLYTIALEKVK
ncbi:putative PH-like domain superfamily, NECAP, PHear domain-containing protein [Helianthus debilis subsp. tardiflorus]